MDERKVSDREDLLDRMLAAYGEVELPVGLEARILGQIEKKLSRRRRRMWLFLAGPAVVTAAVLVIVFSRHMDPPKSMQIPNVGSARTRDSEQAHSHKSDVDANGPSAQVP